MKGGLADAERLSTDAEVSVEAAANRIVTLADEPAVVLCLTWSHKPADRPALRKGTDVPKRLRVRYAVTRHVNLYVPKFKGCEDGIERETTTLPGTESAGPFRVEAKRYGTERLERVLAIARPTA